MLKRFFAVFAAFAVCVMPFSGTLVFAEPESSTVGDENISEYDVLPDTELLESAGLTGDTYEAEEAEEAVETVIFGEDADDLATEDDIDEEILWDELNSAESAESLPTFSTFEVSFGCVLDGWPRDDYVVFNIYTEDGVMVDSETLYITSDIGDFTLYFDVPESVVGTVFYLEVTGVNSIDYYSVNYAVPLDSFLPLYTWLESDEYGEARIVNSAYMTLHTRTQCPINIYVDGAYTQLSSPAIFDGSYIIAPLSELAEAIGITDCTYDPKYNSVTVKTGDYKMLVNIGYSYATVFGSDISLDVPASNINSLTYIEVRPFVESFGCTLEYADGGDYIDIRLNKSPLALESISALESRINSSGVGSSTGYLIWVNKAKFKCSVFSGYKGNWTWVKDFTVGIGASSSETVTGLYEYSTYTSRWTYDSYYVGPVMIFYGGYALHSTLLRYDGTPYNNSVGVKLSHGCVRCQPQHINWMAENIPLHTRVYVTEN